MDFFSSVCLLYRGPGTLRRGEPIETFMPRLDHRSALLSGTPKMEEGFWWGCLKVGDLQYWSYTRLPESEKYTL